MAMQKMTHSYQKLTVGDKTFSIPPNFNLILCNLSLQTHPKYWEDPLTWKPQRWITSGQLPSLSEQLQQETLITPYRNTYFPWSDGPQNCPGYKFAQVEFVAVMACLLKDHRIGVAQEPGEKFEQAQKRIFETTEDASTVMLLQMRNPSKVHLVCKHM